MKLRPLTISLLALGACSSASNTPASPPWSLAGPPTGTQDRPLLDACDLGQAFLLEQFKLSCPVGFPPSVRHAEFWGERPCLSVLTKPDGTEILRTNLSAVSTASDAKALLSAELGALLGAAPTITYQHGEGGRLDGLTVALPGAQPVTYAYRYDGDRRVSEGQVAADGTYRPSYFYVYDSDGRLIREGSRTKDNSAPPAPAAEIIADCQRPSGCGSMCEEAFTCANAPTVPMLSAEDPGAVAVARATYSYEGERLKSVVVAGVPGLRFARVDYTYEGAQLRSVSGGAPDNAEPIFGLHRETFTYSCGQ